MPDYLVGSAALVVVLGSFALAARRARHALIGAAEPVLAFMVELVLVMAGLVLTGQALGTVGAFNRPALVLAAIALGAVGLRALPRAGATGDLAPEPAVDPRTRSGWPSWLCWAAVALVAVRWVERLLETFPRGIGHADVLHYHGPMAAIWAQTGNTWDISFWSVGDASAYHPGNAELLHSIGMVLLGNDLLSFAVNLPFLALALGAGWRVGLRHDNPLLGMTAVSALFVLRFVTAEAGQILNDAIPLSLLVVTVALLEESRERARQSRWLALSGLAAGLAIGTKLTVVVPVVALVALVAAVARRPARGSLLYVAGALVGGGYWYLRNLVITGNPIPAFEHGPFRGPTFPELRRLEHSIFSYLGDGQVWREYFVPGVRSALGPLHPVLPGVALLGALAILVRRRGWSSDRVATALALVGLVSFLGYLANPSAAYGEDGDPWVFKANIRYAFPAFLLCGLALVAHDRVRERPRAAIAVALGVFGACALYRPDVPRFVVGLVVVGALIAAHRLLRSLTGAPRSAAIGLLAVAAVTAGYAAQELYLSHRWTDRDPPVWRVYRHAQALEGSHFAVTGQPQSYPFYGEQLGNSVAYVGVEVDHVYVPVESCQAWWAWLDAFGADHVAVLSERHLAASSLGVATVVRPTEWLESAGARVVMAAPDAVLYSLEEAEPSCSDAQAV